VTQCRQDRLDVRLKSTHPAIIAVAFAYGSDFDVANATLAGTTKTEHTYLMERLKTPPNWRLWIARHNGRVWASSYVRQAITIGIFKGGLPPETPDRSVAKNVQFVTLGLGQLLVLVTSTTVRP
jgi:hypothetical protein